MTQVIPRSKSRKVNGYVKAVLALEATAFSRVPTSAVNASH
jgi:hypothetical protein